MVLISIDFPDISSVDKTHKRLFETADILSCHDFNKLFDNYALSSPCNKIYRTSLLKGSNYLRFDTSISYAEDLLFNLEYFHKIRNVRLINEVTYHYVKHLSSGTFRYHKNTAYTLCRLSQASKETIDNFTESSYKFLMRHYIWGLTNIFHKDSQLTPKQRKAEIGMIVSIPEFRNSRNICPASA